MILAVANQKGGVGKTTTAHNLGQWLHLSGYKVLFVDLDSQINLSYTMRASVEGLTVYDILHGKATAEKAIQHTKNGDIIAGSPLLAGSDRKLSGKGADLKLKNALAPVTAIYDFIVIDSPPALGIQTINAFTAADYVIIPAQADIYSLQGIGQLYGTIQAVQQHTNAELKIAGILLTRFNGKTILSRDLLEMIEETAEQLKTKVYKAQIREGIAVKEAQASGESIFTYAPRSNAAKDYSAFVIELLEDIAHNGKN